MAVVSVVLTASLGSDAEGDILQVEDSVAENLISAGLAREATAEDVSGGEVEEEVFEEAPVDLSKSIEEAAVKAAEKATQAALKSVRESRPNLAPNKVYAQPKDRTGGFKSLGDFMLCEYQRAIGNTSAAQKMANYRRMRTKDVMTVGEPLEGGNLVPEEWADRVFRLQFDDVPNLLEMCTRIPMRNQTIHLPSITQLTGATPLNANYVAENDTIASSMAQTDDVELTLNKIATIVNVSEELLKFNSYALGAVLEQCVPERMQYMINDSVINGSNGGANIIGNSGTVVVTRSSPGAISVADIVNMESRMWSGSKARSAWFCSPSTLAALRVLSFGTSQYPVFLPASNNTSANIAFPLAGTIFGRNVYEVENCPALGSKGDLILANLSQYYAGYSDIDGAMTAALYWVTAVNSFRWIQFVASANPLKVPYTRKDGTTAGNSVVLSGGSSSSA